MHSWTDTTTDRQGDEASASPALNRLTESTDEESTRDG